MPLPLEYVMKLGSKSFPDWSWDFVLSVAVISASFVAGLVVFLILAVPLTNPVWYNSVYYSLQANDVGEWLPNRSFFNKNIPKTSVRGIDRYRRIFNVYLGYFFQRPHPQLYVILPVTEWHFEVKYF